MGLLIILVFLASLSFAQANNVSWSFEREFQEVLISVQKRVANASPKQNPQLFSCKHGSPGTQGAKGYDGDFDMENGMSITAEMVAQHELDKNLLWKCNVTEAIEVAFERLEKQYGGGEIPERHLIGPFGRFGDKGPSAREELSEELRKHCFGEVEADVSLDSKHTCPFVDHIVSIVSQSFSAGLCPPDLEGPMGLPGPRGRGGLTARYNTEEWKEHVRTFCKNCQ